MKRLVPLGWGLILLSCGGPDKTISKTPEPVAIDTGSSVTKNLALPDTLVGQDSGLHKGDTLSSYDVLRDVMTRQLVQENNHTYVLGRHRYYISSVIGHPDCNGTFCVEEEHYVVDLGKPKDTLHNHSWGYLGLFGDVNHDGRLDFIELNEAEDEIIWEAQHFELSVETLVEKPAPHFELLKDQNGKAYFINLYYPHGLFGQDPLKRQWLVVTDLYWPFE